jgi:threonine synthase
LKDPDVTVAYHSGDQALFEAKLGSRGVQKAEFANSPIVVENNLEKIIAVLEQA